MHIFNALRQHGGPILGMTCEFDHWRLFSWKKLNNWKRKLQRKKSIFCAQSWQWFQLHNKEPSADPEGGTGGPDPPPPEICQRYGLVWRFDGKERGSKGCVYLIIVNFFFWLASLASIIQTYYRYTYFKAQFSVLNGQPFSIFPLSKLWKESNFPSLAFMKGHFHIFLV